MTKRKTLICSLGPQTQETDFELPLAETSGEKNPEEGGEAHL